MSEGQVAVSRLGKRAMELGLSEGIRVWVNCALPGQPPAAVWVVTEIEPDPGLHLVVSRVGEAGSVSFRLPLVAVRPVPVVGS